MEHPDFKKTDVSSLLRVGEEVLLCQTSCPKKFPHVDLGTGYGLTETCRGVVATSGAVCDGGNKDGY